jgi:hypothetical protein
VQIGRQTFAFDEVAFAVFNSIWDQLELESKVDGKGGCEYERVLQGFHPTVLWGFLSAYIHASANCVP